MQDVSKRKWLESREKQKDVRINGGGRTPEYMCFLMCEASCELAENEQMIQIRVAIGLEER